MSDSAQGAEQSTDPQVKRVVWIRVGALGDLLVSLRALESSLKRFPNAKFWIVGPRLWLDILNPNQWPQIDGVLATEGGQNGSFFETKKPELIEQNLNDSRAWHLTTPNKKLKHLYQQADATINLRIESYRFAWGPWRAGVKIRIGSCPSAMKWLYTHHYPWLSKEPQIHERDWYDGVARAKKQMSLSDIPLGELHRNGLPRLTKADTNRSEWLWGLKNKDFVIVNPTASRIEKAWSKENYQKLVTELAKKTQVIVVGAPHETDWLKFVAGTKARVIQPQSLGDLFDLVAAAKFIVCNTSSLQFIAAAQKTKALVLMGLAEPIRWGPVGPEDQIVPAEKKDFDSGLNLFEREQQAYASIPPEKVLKALQVWLNNS